MVAASFVASSVSSTEIRVGRCRFKGEDSAYTLEIFFIAGNQNSSHFAAGIGKQNVEDETFRCRSKSDALIRDQPGKGLTQGFPCRRRRIDDTPTLVIRLEDCFFQLAEIAAASRAGSQLGGDDSAEVQAGSRRLNECFQGSCVFLASGGGDETVGIQYELAHRC